MLFITTVFSYHLNDDEENDIDLTEEDLLKLFQQKDEEESEKENNENDENEVEFSDEVRKYP